MIEGRLVGAWALSRVALRVGNRREGFCLAKLKRPILTYVKALEGCHTSGLQGPGGLLIYLAMAGEEALLGTSAKTEPALNASLLLPHS